MTIRSFLTRFRPRRRSVYVQRGGDNVTQVMVGGTSTMKLKGGGTQTISAGKGSIAIQGSGDVSIKQNEDGSWDVSVRG